MIHRSGLFVAPYLLRQLSRSPRFPHRITCVSSFPPSNIDPGFNPRHSVILSTSFSNSRGATNKRCIIKYAFLRHFRGDFHVGMYQRSPVRSILRNERWVHGTCAPCLLKKVSQPARTRGMALFHFVVVWQKLKVPRCVAKVIKFNPLKCCGRCCTRPRVHRQMGVASLLRVHFMRCVNGVQK
jgi:hypothetical protein